MAHFLVGCGEFERDRLMLLDDVCRIVGAREYLVEFWRVDEEERWHCYWKMGWRGICNRVMEYEGECVLHWLGRWWQRRKQLL